MHLVVHQSGHNKIAALQDIGNSIHERIEATIARAGALQLFPFNVDTDTCRARHFESGVDVTVQQRDVMVFFAFHHISDDKGKIFCGNHLLGVSQLYHPL